MAALIRVLVLLAGPALASAQSCPDKVYDDTGIGGGGTVTALANVTSQAACCALCHANYHDECSGWVYGPPNTNGLDGALPLAPAHPWYVGGLPFEALGLPSDQEWATHNCAVMATNGPRKPVANHVSGINANAPPPPPPLPPKHAGAPCNADLDCAPLTAANWRCKAASANASTAANNCHVPGPGTKGNSTCACSVAFCTNGPNKPTNPAAKIQYLVIGDSISLGMESDLAALTAADGWEQTHNPGNAASSNLGAHCLSGWVQAAQRKYDVISFQFGLHDLGFDTERITVEQYTALLTNITAELVAVQKQYGTKLLWVKTTPVPTVPTYGPSCNDTSKCLNPPRFDADVVLYNAAADTVMAAAVAKGATIATADLYSFVLAKCGGHGYQHCDGFQLPMNVHYTAAGWTALAAEMHGILQKL